MCSTQSSALKDTSRAGSGEKKSDQTTGILVKARCANASIIHQMNSYTNDEPDEPATNMAEYGLLVVTTSTMAAMPQGLSQDD
jgi:hypothetical protein